MDDTLWTSTERDGWTVRLLTASDGLTVPTDVEVFGPDGRTWVGTVATLPMIDAIMESYRESGECLSGTYFWIADLLLVRDNTESSAFESVFSLVSTGEIDDCFRLVEPD